MKIRLERVGPHTCLPLPAAAAEAAGYAPGDHVEVAWEAARRMLVVRPLAAALPAARAGTGDVDFARALDEFVEQYSESLMELAADDHALSHGG